MINQAIVVCFNLFPLKRKKKLLAIEKDEKVMLSVFSALFESSKISFSNIFHLNLRFLKFSKMNHKSL